MNLIGFNEMYSNNLLSSFTNTGSLINPGIILGALIITVILVVILVVLLVKGIKNIKDLTRNSNDKFDDETLEDDSVEDSTVNNRDIEGDGTDDSLVNDRNIEDDGTDVYIDDNGADDDRVLVPSEPGDSYDINVISYLDKLVDINDDLEPYGFAYDSETDDFYSTMYPWQRQFGYCSLYDEAAPALSLIFDSEPIYFDYKGKHWLIQFWKGQYGVTTGAEEIGRASCRERV